MAHIGVGIDPDQWSQLGRALFGGSSPSPQEMFNKLALYSKVAPIFADLPPGEAQKKAFETISKKRPGFFPRLFGAESRYTFPPPGGRISPLGHSIAEEPPGGVYFQKHKKLLVEPGEMEQAQQLAKERYPNDKEMQDWFIDRALFGRSMAPTRAEQEERMVGQAETQLDRMKAGRPETKEGENVAPWATEEQLQGRLPPKLGRLYREHVRGKQLKEELTQAQIEGARGLGEYRREIPELRREGMELRERLANQTADLRRSHEENWLRMTEWLRGVQEETNRIRQEQAQTGAKRADTYEKKTEYDIGKPYPEGKGGGGGNKGQVTASKDEYKQAVASADKRYKEYLTALKLQFAEHNRLAGGKGGPPPIEDITKLPGYYSYSDWLLLHPEGQLANKAIMQAKGRLYYHQTGQIYRSAPSTTQPPTVRQQLTYEVPGKGMITISPNEEAEFLQQYPNAVRK